jgi:hypothetical protein
MGVKTMKAIAEFREYRDAPVKAWFNVSGNSIGRIQSIVSQYANHKGYKFTHIYYDQSQNGLTQLTNYKGTSYIK